MFIVLSKTGINLTFRYYSLMDTAEQIELINNQIETHREQFIDILMFAFDVEEIPTETHLKILENLKSYEIVQKKYIQALETEQIKFDLFCKQ